MMMHIYKVVWIICTKKELICIKFGLLKSRRLTLNEDIFLNFFLRNVRKKVEHFDMNAQLF